MALPVLSIAALAVLSSQAPPSHSWLPRRPRRWECVLLEAFGHSGITFALLRRFQGPAWIGMGWRYL